MSFFGSVEADRNFERNIHYRATPSLDAHPVIQAFNSFPISSTSVLEIGAGNGCVLARIQQFLPEAELCGIDPSAKGVDYGNTTFPGIKLTEGTCEDLTKIYSVNQFDLVIFGGVLFHVDPRTILQVLSSADSLLREGGLLMFFDFYPRQSSSVAYKHEDGLQIYKYDHQAIIDSVPHYKRLLYKAVWSDESYSRASSYDLDTAHYVSIHLKEGLKSYANVNDPTLR